VDYNESREEEKLTEYLPACSVIDGHKLQSSSRCFLGFTSVRLPYRYIGCARFAPLFVLGLIMIIISLRFSRKNDSKR
jgi:hypothetical protein